MTGRTNNWSRAATGRRGLLREQAHAAPDNEKTGIQRPWAAELTVDPTLRHVHGVITQPVDDAGTRWYLDLHTCLDT
jgi:hypothetical protein